MKLSQKVQAALERRIKSYTPFTPHGMKCHKPGSQNRKKGAAIKRSTRH